MKTKINFNGQTVEAERMDFTPVREEWSRYRLEDGTIIKLRSIVSEILRLPGFDPVTGVRNFLTRSSNVVAVEAPDELVAMNEEIH